jgi:hypothetical protein
LHDSHAAVAAGFAVFIVTRRSTPAGVVCGELVMLAGKWWLGWYCLGIQEAKGNPA